MTYGAFYNVKQKVCACGNKYLGTASSKRCLDCKFSPNGQKGQQCLKH